MARPPAPVCKAVRRPLGVQSDRRGGLHIRPMPHCRVGCTSAKRTFVGVDAHIDPRREAASPAGLAWLRDAACTTGFRHMPPDGGRADMGIGPYGRNHWTPARIGARFRAAIQAAPTGGCSLV